MRRAWSDRAVATLIGSTVIAAAILVSTFFLIHTREESDASRDGYGAGYERDSASEPDDSVCDGENITVGDRAATPSEVSDDVDGCRDGFADREEK